MAAAYRYLLIALLLTACGDSPVSAPSGDPYTIQRVNAAGETVSLSHFSGRYLWVDYAAEWCAACVPQTRELQSVARYASSAVNFVTVMTSEFEGYGHPATQETAARWAGQFNLDPRKVLAANLTSMTLPRHILFSPDGKKLFDYTGAMSKAEIEAVIEKNTN